MAYLPVMRILFVAPLHSPHTARWISQLEGTGWDIQVFGGADPIYPLLKNVVVYKPYPTNHDMPVNVRVDYHWRFRWGVYSLTKRIPTIGKYFLPSPGIRLSRVIQKSHPTIIHSLKMQNESYWVFKAREHLGGELPCPWIYSSWGSDISYYRRLPTHLKSIRDVLSSCDYYISDCDRDIAMAREEGFRGKVLGVFPGPGSFDIKAMQLLKQPGLPSTRRIIALKGYQAANGGQALIALEAIAKTASALKDYQVVIHSANGAYGSSQLEQVRQLANRIQAEHNILIQFLPYGSVEEIWSLFGRSRISIGISLRDGTPNTLLEAMIMGAFPIQSDTAAADEWIKNGETGFIVPVHDSNAIAQAISKAVEDDVLVDNAATLNAEVTRGSIDSAILRPVIRDMYKQIAKYH